MKVRSGDKVKIISGKDRGKVGRVERVYPKQGRLTVSGASLAKRHTRPTRENPEGGVVEKPIPLPASVVMVMCNSCGKAVRVGFSWVGGKKQRVCRSCGSAFS